MINTRWRNHWHIGILVLLYSCYTVYTASLPISLLLEQQTTELTEGFLTEPTINYEEEDIVHTWRPRRQNCSPPALEQFPRPLMGPRMRKHGGLVLHVLVAIYTFLGLAIVCDVYFVASLERICEELKLSPDVAGATFMAAGSSAPELATFIVGIFFAKDDIGISGVIESAVFNIMFVISMCALCSGTVCQLNWWPLVRDCFFYSVSIFVMIFVILNDTISSTESIIMLLCYVVYCIALHFNPQLKRWAHSLKRPSQGEQTAPIDIKAPANQTTVESQAADNRLQNPVIYKSRNITPGDMVNPLDKPTDGGICAKISWAIVYPIHFLCRLTMPDCRTEKNRNWYPLTFVISIIWISIYSYYMVWMITIIGATLGIPDSVMGITFVAAGVSVPDVLSSIAVIKKGYGDMAVSNAVGSNVFKNLICLGLPLFIQTTIIKPGSHVNVISKGLAYFTFSLLSTVTFLLFATHMNGWKLDKRLGVILMFWYILFITIASLYELNVFGQFNPPECMSYF